MSTSGCPQWCTRPGHDVDGDFELHWGPSFGDHIDTLGEATATVSGCVNISVEKADEMSASDLRALAASALEAAEWLETLNDTPGASAVPTPC